MDTSSGDLSLLDYVRPVWRFKWLVLLVVVLAAGGTYLAFRHGSIKYAASTQLYVGSTASSALTNPNAGFIAPSVFAEDASLVSTPQVASQVISDLHLPTTPTALLSALTVVPDSTSDSITLIVTTPQSQLALNLVNGFARAYLEVSTQAVKTYEESEVKSLRQELALHMSASQRTVLTNELDTLEGQLALPPQVGQFAPALASTVIKPNPKRDAIFAGALALLLGLIACYVFDRSDRRLRRLDDIERLLGAPVLATIPHVRRADPSNGDKAATVVALREPYRTLRVNLDMIRLQEGARTIMVTSALPSEGKTTVVRNLALAYRESGLSVAIIEGDMRRPVLASLFGIPRSSERGLSDILEDRGDVGDALITVAGEPGSAERIDLLPAGQAPENPTALLNPEAFRTVRNQLLADHALVLVDSPPILAVSDALVMAGQVDGVLLVVRAAVSTDATVRRLRQAVSKVPHTKILGAVANAVSDNLGYASSYYLPSPYEPFETPSLQE